MASPSPPADFESDLVIRFDGGRAFTGELVYTHPTNLNVRLQTSEDAEGYMTELHVLPLLLNPAEGFRLRFLLAGELPAPALSARIAGITELGWFDRDTEPQHLKLLRSLAVTLVVFLLMSSATWAAARYGLAWIAAIPALIGFLLIFLFLFLSLLGPGFRVTTYSIL